MKKKTRLLILSVIATLAFTSAFAACGKKGGNNNGGSSSSEPSSSSEVVDGSSEVVDGSSEVVDGSSEVVDDSSEVVDDSSEAGSDSSDGGVVTPATYAFTKWINRTDMMNGFVTSNLEEGAELDLSEPDAVEGKVFEGWFYKDGTAVEEGTLMGTEAVVIYAKWTITPYTVTIKQAGVEDVVLTFGVESNYDDLDNSIIGISELNWVITEQLYKSTDYLQYTFEGMPATAEDWKLENCEITVTATADVEKAVEAGVENANKVTNGSITVENTYFIYDSTTSSSVTYELAEDYAKIADAGYTYWYMGYGEGKVLALVDYGYGVNVNGYPTVPEMTKGYAFETVFDYTNTYYGVETFVSTIYGLADEKVESYENGVYEFSLVYVNAGDHTKYEVSVEFTLSDASVMETVEIQINTFYENIQEDENGFVYDEEGNPKYLGTYNETADALRVYTITQAIDGEVVVAYNPEEILVSSYTLKDAEGKEVSELDLVAGAGVTLTMADVPEKADATFDTFTVTVVDVDGIEVDSSFVNVYVETYSKEIYVTAYAEGEYTITIESGLVTKELTASVELPETTEIYAKSGWSTLTEATIYDDGVVTFEVAANDYADASAEVVVTSAPDGADGTLEEVDGEWTFSPDAGVEGTYVITITSLVADGVSGTVTITVNKAPELSTIFNGEYQNSDKAKDKQLYVLIGPEVSDGTYGQILISLNKTMYGWDGSVEGTVQQYCVYVYSYDVDSRMVELVALPEADVIESGINELYPGYTYSETVLMSMELTADYTLKVVYGNDMTTLVPYVELTPAQWVAGDYVYQIDEDNRLFLQIWDDGTAALVKERKNSKNGFWGPESEVGFKYTVDSSFAIDITEITNGEMEGFTVDTVPVFDQAANTITVTIGETEYVFA